MLLAAFGQYFFGITIFISSIFLIMLVLVQRGRGGGLTGALGGPGGQSAFGTKAGDLFTRITIGVAAVWIFLCAAAVFFLKAPALPSTGLTTVDTIGSDDVSSGSVVDGTTSGGSPDAPAGEAAGAASNAEITTFPESSADDAAGDSPEDASSPEDAGSTEGEAPQDDNAGSDDVPASSTDADASSPVDDAP